MKRITKKTLSILLAVIMLISAVPFAASAISFRGTCGDNVKWTYNTLTGALNITGSGKMWNYDVSDSAPWYNRSDYIKSVNIENGVTSVSDYAFGDCINLTSANIPNGVTSIGDSAFEYCSSLTSVTIPDSVTSIGDWAFESCSKLTSVNIPNNVASIGYAAFSNCSSLTSVTIPNSVTSIGDCAFEYCNSLTSITVDDDNKNYSSFEGVLFNKDKTELIQYPIGNTQTNYTIPNGVTSICDDAFSDCDSLTSITIPNGVTSMGEGTFSDCNSLTSVTIPNSVTSIGYFVFSGCSSLTSVTIPNGATSIDDFAFSGCSSLTSVTIPNSVTSIGNMAFSECSGLTSVTIPSSVASIGYSAFFACSSLTSITVDSDNKNYCDFDGVLFSKDKTELIQYPAGNTQTSYEIPNTVTSIENGAFYGCSNLTSVTIPKSVTDMGWFAFEGCSSLKDVYYQGTEYDWNKIESGIFNESLANVTIHFQEPDTENCKCVCHKSGFISLIWKFVRIIYKIFHINQICVCGTHHY